MVRLLPITVQFAVSPALAADDFAHVAQMGYRTVISFVPDGENARVLPAAEAARAAQRHGLSFVHIPAANYDLLTGEVVSAARSVLESAKGPVLGTCVSGQRAAIVWAAAKSASTPVDDILETLGAAGLNLAFLRDDLETQAQRSLLATGDFSRAA